MDNISALVIAIGMFLIGVIVGMLIWEYYTRKVFDALLRCTIPRIKKLRGEVKR